MKLLHLSLWLTIFLLTACGNDDFENNLFIDNKIKAKNFELDINENQSRKVVLGKLQVEAYDYLNLVYTLQSSNVEDAISINAANGQVQIKNPAVFDYEKNQQITAKYTVTDGFVTDSANININIQDIKEAFISTVKVEEDDIITFAIDRNKYSYDFTIDWGDGQSDANITTNEITHTYEKSGDYKISIQGECPAIQLNSDKIIAVNAWGDTKWQSMEKMFKDCKNLISLPASAPNLSLVENMSKMFKNAERFNVNINHWNISNVVDISGMFHNAMIYNQNMDQWNTSKVKYINDFLNNARKYNHDLSNWTVNSIMDCCNAFTNTNMNLDKYPEISCTSRH